MQPHKRQKMQAKEHGFDHDQQTTQIAVNGGEDEFAFNPTKGTSEVPNKAHETIEHNQEVSLEEVRRGSDAVEQSMEEIRIKMETFTDMVSRLLENAKTFFSQTLQSFEDGLVELHQQQMQKWEDELTALRTLDYDNEDALARLTHAQDAIGSLGALAHR
ncbi:hypothetical protein KFL_000490040 [Klebsormidium nitens]|uniref:Uncharacterized protein n=1 Tax=Klebsormidium nitens TaxID=105231 RepID=A0A0U9HI95_KLENI|nr:hypothetical protein KFL_000490040 [Klebsormidium nitens]|eukprot:GAQ80214.1 hypothetical protein KFL_000490040 [Klebsormidium nitens]